MTATAAAAAAAPTTSLSGKNVGIQRGSFKRLWIGGSSGLTRTYMNAISERDCSDACEGVPVLAEDWILMGHEATAPPWMPANAQYISYNFTTSTTTTTTASDTQDGPSADLLEQLQHVQQIVIGIRPPLVTSMTHIQMDAYSNSIVSGLDIFLRAVINSCKQVHSILHISSIAAINHLEAQHMVSEDDPVRNSVRSIDLLAPYDRFKRACEERIDAIVTNTATSESLQATTLRLGAIFSDDPSCIQCQALALQARVGCYLPTNIDCNSSRNVVAAIRLVLEKQQKEQQHQKALSSSSSSSASASTSTIGQSRSRYYYYTRPVQFREAIPYGRYLLDYRNAHNITLAVWIPAWTVQWVVATVHWFALTRLAKHVPYLESVDYLLQVSAREHSFDCSRFAADFTELVSQEENYETCFRRRQRQLLQSSSSTTTSAPLLVSNNATPDSSKKMD
jgi:hypothetical protein